MCPVAAFCSKLGHCTPAPLPGGVEDHVHGLTLFWLADHCSVLAYGLAALCSDPLQSFLCGFSSCLSSHLQAKSFAHPPWLFGWKCALFSHQLPGITANPGWKTLPAAGRKNKTEVGRSLKSGKRKHFVLCVLGGRRRWRQMLPHLVAT